MTKAFNHSSPSFLGLCGQPLLLSGDFVLFLGTSPHYLRYIYRIGSAVLLDVPFTLISLFWIVDDKYLCELLVDV